MTDTRQSADFSFKSTGVTFQELAGGGVTHINFEGTAAGFGTVLGTMSFFSATQGAETGRTHWVGTAFLDDGTEVYGSSDGVWSRTGRHAWRVRGVMPISLGTTYMSDGIVSLDGRTYKGKITEWA
jgi:hypothetical protein